jgi:hypothetical protein
MTREITVRADDAIGVNTGYPIGNVACPEITVVTRKEREDDA